FLAGSRPGRPNFQSSVDSCDMAADCCVAACVSLVTYVAADRSARRISRRESYRQNCVDRALDARLDRAFEEGTASYKAAQGKRTGPYFFHLLRFKHPLVGLPRCVY